MKLDEIIGYNGLPIPERDRYTVNIHVSREAFKYLNDQAVAMRRAGVGAVTVTDLVRQAIAQTFPAVAPMLGEPKHGTSWGVPTEAR